MSDLEQLIEVAYRLSNTLSLMAENELKFGWELGIKLEHMSFEALKLAEQMRDLKGILIGGVA